jgi:acetolactate synthase I/II/III large subunit
MDLVGPEPDFGTIARGMGLSGIGPISEPGEIRPALEAAISEVKAGKPALVDVITQHR